MNTKNQKEATPAEQELIRIRREEARLAKEKTEAIRKVEEARAVKEKEKDIEEEGKLIAETNAAIDSLFRELFYLGQGEYACKEEFKEKTYNLYHEFYGEDQSKSKPYYTAVVPFWVKSIHHTSSGADITAHHFSVRGVSSFKMKSQGIRFKLIFPGVYDRRNENLKSAKTIHEKIASAVRASDLKEKRKKRALIILEQMQSALTKMYPQAAEIKTSREQGQWFGHGTRRKFIEGDQFTQVTFQNGFQLKYRWEDDAPVLCNIIIRGLSHEDKEQLIKMFAK